MSVGTDHHIMSQPIQTPLMRVRVCISLLYIHLLTTGIDYQEDENKDGGDMDLESDVDLSFTSIDSHGE